MNKNEWQRITVDTPVEKIIIETKIDDKDGCRNVQNLIFYKKLWWLTDMSMYVYYTPTHWRYANIGNYANSY